jgi:hypothetical protein
MRKLRRAVWPILVGLLGGLTAFEGHLACDLTITPHYGVWINAEVCFWLVVGLLGPGLWLVLERPAVVRRAVDLARRPRRRQLVAIAVLSLLVGAAAGVGATRHLETSAVPLSLLSAGWTVFFSVSFVTALALFVLVSYPGLSRRFGWRVALSLGAAIAVYVKLGFQFELWPEYWWPGRL